MRSVFARMLFLFLLLACNTSSFSQSGNPADVADAAYRSQNWSAAEKLYEQLTESEPAVTRYWYRLGVAAQINGDHRKALDAFEKSRGKGVPPQLLEYNLAAVHASMGHSDKAFAELDQALKAGFANPAQLTSDSDMASLRSDPRFNKALEQAKHNQSPCSYAPESRQFDFWVGDWKVSPTAGGPQQGASHIAKELGNCVIWENWTSLSIGYAGKSYNAYNPNLKRWEQFWVDNAGGLIHFYGGLKDGVMDYWTDEVPQPDGSKLKRHLQFFNQGPNQVRQFSQGSKDGGKTWFVEYDFTYVRSSAGS